jgi:ABC-type branched-subunit amino acid transport system permease subunit
MSASSPWSLDRSIRSLLWKWGVVLLVPVLVYTFLWQGDSVVNAAFLGLVYPDNSTYAVATPGNMVQALIFSALFYLLVTALSGYLLAVDSGRHSFASVWVDVVLYAVVPILLIALTNDLVIGTALSAVAWGAYFLGRAIARRRFNRFLPVVAPADPPAPIANAELRRRAIIGSVSFGVVLALIWIVVDIVFYVSGSFPSLLLLTILLPVRTVLLVVGSYFMGHFAARVAQNFTVEAYARRNKRREAKGLKALRPQRSQLTPNDNPLRSSGARVIFMVALLAFVLLYPALDSFLFSYGTGGRLAGYGDAGYYVILALGLNIVVGFAGLLDLGYVAFFAIGAYAWAIVGSSQFGQLFNIFLSNSVASGLFWPMLLGAALLAAFFGVILGLPTLRLRGDYLAIVTLGFGEIVPIVALNLRQITNGTNGLVGIRSPGFFGLAWNVTTPVPYYYLILVLIGLTIFAAIRLRDSRLGRAWVAIREDEIAAASSGINLRNTKLLAFGAGAFFSGIAGAYHGAKLGVISPDVFSYGDSIIFLAMVVIGGLGSIPGVIVGALAVYSLYVLILGQLDTMAAVPHTFMYNFHTTIIHIIPGFTFGNIRNLTFGVLLILIMIFRPEGLIPSARRKRELHENQDEQEPDVLGSLDVTLTDPAFESEVRVE